MQRTLTGRVARGLTIAARASAAPALIGFRWARGRSEDGGIPAPRWNAALASKVALDEFFFASEVATATFVSLRDRHRLASELAAAEAEILSEPAPFHRLHT